MSQGVAAGLRMCMKDSVELNGSSSGETSQRLRTRRRGSESGEGEQSSGVAAESKGWMGRTPHPSYQRSTEEVTLLLHSYTGLPSERVPARSLYGPRRCCATALAGRWPGGVVRWITGERWL
eukprot:1759074-Prymnesium_polylepis.1